MSSGLVTSGCPFAVEFVRSGYCVTGIDKSKQRVEFLNKGKSYVIDVRGKDVALFVEKGLLHVTNDAGVLLSLDVISVCVPTPLTKKRPRYVLHYQCGTRN